MKTILTFAAALALFMNSCGQDTSHTLSQDNKDTQLALTSEEKQPLLFTTIDKKTDQAGAIKYCTELGGHLAVPQDEEERDALFNFARLAIPEANSVFLGVVEIDDDLYSNTDWGKTIKDGSLMPFADFDADEPNNFDETKEACLEMYVMASKDPKAGKYNDVDCQAERHFVCELRQ